MTPTATRPYQHIEPEHVVWILSRIALITALLFVPILIFSPGLTFWVDVLTVIPIMLMGGMCSESMMIRIISTLTNIAILTAALSAARFLAGKLRFAFDEAKQGGRTGLLELPGPTVWQARLDDVYVNRHGSAQGKRALFRRRVG